MNSTPKKYSVSASQKLGGSTVDIERVINDPSTVRVARAVANQQPGQPGQIIWIDKDGVPSLISKDVLEQRLAANPDAGVLGLMGTPEAVAKAAGHLDAVRKTANARKYSADLIARLRSGRKAGA